MSETLANLLSEDRVFEPSAEFVEQANAGVGVYERAGEDRLEFWRGEAL
nr:hypothetical protein [Actinomycetota bacterium]NIS37424.1 hypothetical protein [Actinomycetota bacterium]NIT98839.1 hypothetical protein [Actinomycetota bacterium]NIU22463.1 hypothetical protein [Actinomycetota bacterium]NIU71851.1 hypothetical protein [Actinomycetota bacterium]